MKPAQVTVTRSIDAAPAIVYGILADYRTHHPRILPKPEFEDLVVEDGGTGAGTVVRVVMKVMGARQTIRMRVSEPAPGRVLQETDIETGAVTTFTVASTGGGDRSEVTIASEWPAPGVRAWIQGKIAARVARGLYARELALLDEHARKHA